MTRSHPGTIAVLYEHDEWFRPLFAELKRRALPYTPVRLSSHHYPIGREQTPALVFNRMSPSAFLRGPGSLVPYALQYLDHFERQGVRVINGARAYATEISKARQISILDSMGLPHPRTRIIADPAAAPRAAAGLRFPILVKPNVGGSGAGIQRFDSTAALAEAVHGKELSLGLDGIGLVQEFIEPRNQRIVRVEMLAGRLLYALAVRADGRDFNLCPADMCLDPGAVDPSPGDGDPARAYEPPESIVHQVRRILAAADIEVGGVEYVQSEADDRHYFYDVNALSNFVADAPRVVGFDPHVDLVDYVEREYRAVRQSAPVPEVA